MPPRESSQIIRRCRPDEFEELYAIINAAAEAYRGVIPTDCWKEPYMPLQELRHEIDSGVAFWGCEEEGALVGVMGLQKLPDVTLIRHAYVRPQFQRRGIGARLLARLRREATRPMLVGTWADAVWAIRFYEQQGFRLVSPAEKDRLLSEYWTISDRQRQTSVVLVESGKFDLKSVS